MFVIKSAKGLAVDTIPTSPWSCQCEAAAHTAALTYQVGGLSAEVVALPMKEGRSVVEGCAGWAVIVRGLRRFECVFDDTSDLEAANSQVKEIADAGWDAWALVPLRRLASAHDAFRATANFVQGWWEREHNISFTKPQIP
jgi:hypothetical protein